MKELNLSIGDKVDIIYLTYTNNGERRHLRNLEVINIYETYIDFKQGKRVYQISMDFICRIFKHKLK